MSKLNPQLKSSKFDVKRLAGGQGARAAKQDNIDQIGNYLL